jgi:Winged helix-turn helix
MVKCTKRQVRELRTALRWKIAAVQRQRIQMVLLRESGMTQPAIAEAMGVSLSTVNRAHMAYDQGGLKALRPKRCGGRKRENMTIGQEKALLARFAKAAGFRASPSPLIREHRRCSNFICFSSQGRSRPLPC